MMNKINAGIPNLNDVLLATMLMNNKAEPKRSMFSIDKCIVASVNLEFTVIWP
jgi:hypothetical protein